MKNSTLWLPVAAALTLVACENAPTVKTAHPQAPVAQRETALAKPARSAPAGKPASQPASQPSSGNPYEDLARMDTRKPVPLQPMMAWHQKENMQQHLVAIQKINAALARDDWDAVIKAAGMIGSSPQMKMMCQHMGAGAPGFTDRALDFHKRADAIAVAAKKHDPKAVLKATSHTLEACTGCHATYRQDVVDAQTWMQKTGDNHVAGDQGQ